MTHRDQQPGLQQEGFYSLIREMRSMTARGHSSLSAFPAAFLFAHSRDAVDDCAPRMPRRSAEFLFAHSRDAVDDSKALEAISYGFTKAFLFAHSRDAVDD